MKPLKKKYRLPVLGIGVGILYGLLTRIAFGNAASLASITYLFIIPVVLGIIPLMFADDERLRSYRNIIFIPWLTVAGFFIIMALFGVEDIICLFILGLPFFTLGTLGAFIIRWGQITRKKRKEKLMTLLLLPFILAPLEAYFDDPAATYRIESVVFISATPDTVWGNIVEVKPIREDEYKSGFFNWAGTPRPVSAIVTGRGVGEKRTGKFEGGLKFIETITSYEENKKITFSITIDPGTVRQKIFDQHVLKGKYFSFVNAGYRLEDQGGGQVKLTLSSSYRLTSKINFYGRFWGDIILTDFQERLLNTIEKRCEAVPVK